MSDNWEFALQNCSGELLYPIADKILLHKDTLKDIMEGAEKYNRDIYSFCHAELDDNYTKLNYPRWTVFSTQKILSAAFSGDRTLYSTYGLRGYSMVISKKMFNHMINKYGKVLLPLAPDFTLAFMATLHTDSFCYCTNKYFRYNRNCSSNGFSAGYGGALALEYLYAYNYDKNDAVSFVPINVFTIWNSVLNDFIRVCKHCNISYEIDKIDNVNYFKRLYSELVHIHTTFHISMDDSFKKMFDYINHNLTGNERIIMYDYIMNFKLCTVNTVNVQSLVHSLGVLLKNKMKKYFNIIVKILSGIGQYGR